VTVSLYLDASWEIDSREHEPRLLAGPTSTFHRSAPTCSRHKKKKTPIIYLHFLGRTCTVVLYYCNCKHWSFKECPLNVTCVYNTFREPLTHLHHSPQDNVSCVRHITAQTAQQNGSQKQALPHKHNAAASDETYQEHTTSEGWDRSQLTKKFIYMLWMLGNFQVKPTPDILLDCTCTHALEALQRNIPWANHAHSAI